MSFFLVKKIFLKTLQNFLKRVGSIFAKPIGLPERVAFFLHFGDRVLELSGETESKCQLLRKLIKK